jgi:hypothetical protein
MIWNQKIKQNRKETEEEKNREEDLPGRSPPTSTTSSRPKYPFGRRLPRAGKQLGGGLPDARSTAAPRCPGWRPLTSAPYKKVYRRRKQTLGSPVFLKPSVSVVLQNPSSGRAPSPSIEVTRRPAGYPRSSFSMPWTSRREESWREGLHRLESTIPFCL